MNRRVGETAVLLCLAFAFVLTGCRAMGPEGKETKGLHHQVGLSYVSGTREILDQWKDNEEVQGESVSDDVYWPVGLSYRPYYQFDMGLGV